MEDSIFEDGDWPASDQSIRRGDIAMVSEEQFDQLSAAKLQLKPYQVPQWPVDEYSTNRVPQTPSEWFSKAFPVQVKAFGCPFLELTEQTMDGFTRVNPLAQNIDFLAAILGGDQKLGHKVVYLEGEMQFYYFDPRDCIFKPTSDEKLGNLLRALLVRCAEEMPANVHLLNLFLQFRSNEAIRSVVHRAKSILAADETFFSEESKNERKKGREVHERVARVFVEQVLERQPGEVLTLTNAYVAFCEYLKGRGLSPVPRKIFKGMLAPLVRETFDLGLRNDVVDGATNKQTAGWVNLRTSNLENKAVS